jgi:hypothetical protein
MAASDKKRKGKSKVNSAQAYKLGNRAAVNKARVAKRIAKAKVKKIEHDQRRRATGKPERGHTRLVRRKRDRAAAIKGEKRTGNKVVFNDNTGEFVVLTN